MVIHNTETKVAQYGQWDGYPEGQGATALNFLRGFNRDSFISALGKIKWLDEKEMTSFLVSIGCTDGWLNGHQVNLRNEKYPFLSRDHGAKILQLINESTQDEILLTNSSDFAGDSLMCEWAYVIDLDKNTFEVYTGFNKEPMAADERFFSLTPNEDGYYPIRMVKAYSLDELPSTDDFVNEIDALTSEPAE